MLDLNIISHFANYSDMFENNYIVFNVLFYAFTFRPFIVYGALIIYWLIFPLFQQGTWFHCPFLGAIFIFISVLCFMLCVLYIVCYFKIGENAAKFYAYCI